MSNFTIHSLSNTLLFSIIPLSGSACADPITVEVVPHKTVILLGEPVILSTTVHNAGLEPVQIHRQNTPTLVQSLPCVVELQLGADKEQLKRWDDDLRPTKKTRPVSLAPGMTMTVDLLMLFSGETGFFAQQPGKYWISGRIVTTNDVEVVAPPVDIEVREPSRADRSAWEWLNAHKEEYGRLVQIPWEAKLSDEFLQESARLCDTSQSAYVEYLALFLSRAYREGPKKDAEQSVRFAEIAKGRASTEKARSEAEKLLPQSPPKSAP